MTFDSRGTKGYAFRLTSREERFITAILEELEPRSDLFVEMFTNFIFILCFAVLSCVSGIRSLATNKDRVNRHFAEFSPLHDSGKISNLQRRGLGGEFTEEEMDDLLVALNRKIDASLSRDRRYAGVKIKLVAFPGWSLLKGNYKSPRETVGDIDYMIAPESRPLQGVLDWAADAVAREEEDEAFMDNINNMFQGREQNVWDEAVAQARTRARRGGDAFLWQGSRLQILEASVGRELAMKVSTIVDKAQQRDDDDELDVDDKDVVDAATIVIASGIELTTQTLQTFRQNRWTEDSVDDMDHYAVPLVNAKVEELQQEDSDDDECG
ncbi:MAG: hypothetical protein Q9227_006693 [Pyrenula ochraceoflavens]